MKKCSRCKTTKPFDLFYKNPRTKDGRNTFCKICHMEDRKLRRERLRSNPVYVEKERVYKRGYREKTVAQRKRYMDRWRADNADRVIAYKKANYDRSRRYNIEYSKKNSAALLAKCRQRQANQIQRTPIWVGQEELWLISEAYELARLRTKITGIKWHVDHIVPLQGKLVSGLHVPNNMQVIPAVENFRKNNRFEVL